MNRVFGWFLFLVACGCAAWLKTGIAYNLDQMNADKFMLVGVLAVVALACLYGWFRKVIQGK